MTTRSFQCDCGKKDPANFAIKRKDQRRIHKYFNIFGAQKHTLNNICYMNGNR